MFKNEGNYLKEWVEYHRLAGVDHFYLYDNGSTDNSLEVLQPYIQAGLVDVTSWPTAPGKSYLPDQMNATKDGLRRAKGVSRWAAMIDIDEFILPMKEKSIPNCLNKYFASASGIYVNWRHFGTSGVTIPKGEPILFKLTGCSLPNHPENAIGKSIVRPDHVDVDKAFYIHHYPLIEGAFYLDGARQQMQFNGTDLIRGHEHYDQYIRINHYPFRDEDFFQNVRVKNGVYRGESNSKYIQEHYVDFAQTEDGAIMGFIQMYFSKRDQRFWKK